MCDEYHTLVCLTPVLHGAGATITSGMATATIPLTEAAISRRDGYDANFAETLTLAGQLADALEILMQCQARNVPLSNEFLAYVDDLTDAIDMLQPCGTIPRA